MPSNQRHDSLTGASISIDVEPSDTIGAIKQRIYEKHGTAPAAPAPTHQHQRLVFAGKELKNCRSVSSYYINNESTIFLVRDEEQDSESEDNSDCESLEDDPQCSLFQLFDEKFALEKELAHDTFISGHAIRGCWPERRWMYVSLFAMCDVLRQKGVRGVDAATYVTVPDACGFDTELHECADRQAQGAISQEHDFRRPTAGCCDGTVLQDMDHIR